MIVRKDKSIEEVLRIEVMMCWIVFGLLLISANLYIGLTAFAVRFSL